MRSPLASTFRGGFRNLTPMRARGRGMSAFSPQMLGPRALYDALLGGSATQITDSSGNSVAATSFAAGSNTPSWLAADTVPYLYLPAVGGNSLTTPNNAAFNVTDFDMWYDVAVSDYTPSSGTYMGVRSTADPNKQFVLLMNSTSGTVSLYWYPTGSAASEIIRTSSTGLGASAGVADGARVAFRIALDVDNGAAGHTATFQHKAGGYTGSWDNWHSIVTGGTTTAPSVNRLLEVSNALGGVPFKLYRWQLLSGIAGSAVADFNASLSARTGYTDAVGSAAPVWTINRSAAGKKASLVGTRSNVLFGTDDYATAPVGAIPPMGATDAWSIFLAIRQFDTPTNFGRYLSTKLSTGLGKGIAIRSNGTTRQIACHFGDGTNAVDSFGPSAAASGVMQVIVVSCTGPSVTVYVNGTPGTPVDVSSVGDRATGQMEIGRDAGAAGSYQDFELYAYGTVDRALSAADASALSGYFGGGT